MIEKIEKLSPEDRETAENIIKLQQASYRVEAELIGFDGLPPLKDTAESLRKCGEVFYGFLTVGKLAGILSYKRISDILDIHRVAVDPVYFRMGIAEKLLCFAERLESGAQKAVVCTGKENVPAVRLYIKNGYRKKGDVEIEKGVFITEFEKPLDALIKAEEKRKGKADDAD